MRLSSSIVLLICFLSSVHGSAQTRGQRAPAPAARPSAAPSGWLASPIREEPSPSITSLKGAGTANAVAEARLTQKELTEYCQENAQLYPSAAACVKQKQSEYGNKIFRATADCTVGRITTTSDQTYTLDGLWDKSDIGAGRTRWRDADGTIVARDLVSNGLHIAQQWETLCPGPVSAALIARAAQARQAAPAVARAATPPNPPVCGGEPLCSEVNDFAVTIMDFRASLAQPRKVLTLSVRFQNKTDRPIILGYVPASGVGIDERGNRYAAYDADIRGIGIIARTVDAKFVLQPGQRSDARFTYYWDAGRAVYGTTFDLEMTIREILDRGSNQVELGAEYPLRFAGLVDGARPGTSSTGSSSSTAQPAGAPPVSAPRPVSTASSVDNCAGSRGPCHDAGQFSASVSAFSGSIAGNRHHVLRIQLTIRNHSDQPLILAYKSATNSATDNLGNAYYWGRAGTHDGSVQGIGIVTSRAADTQFRLAPGASRNAVFTVIRYESGATPQGQSFAFDTVLSELRILPNGNQSETVREHSVHLADLTLRGGAVGGDEAAEKIKKAGDAIRGIFNRGKK